MMHVVICVGQIHYRCYEVIRYVYHLFFPVSSPQMNSSIPGVPVKMSVYLQHHLVLENGNFFALQQLLQICFYSYHMCKKLVSILKILASTNNESNGGSDMANFTYLSWRLFSAFVVFRCGWMLSSTKFSAFLFSYILLVPTCILFKSGLSSTC